MGNVRDLNTYDAEAIIESFGLIRMPESARPLVGEVEISGIQCKGTTITTQVFSSIKMEKLNDKNTRR